MNAIKKLSMKAKRTKTNIRITGRNYTITKSINRDITGQELYQKILGRENNHYKNLRITIGYKEIYPTHEKLNV